MSSMAQDAIEMGIDPIIAPDGRTWCESSYNQSATSRELWGNLQDGCRNISYSDYHVINDDESEYEIGDIVKLNSSDVLMTIKSIDNDILTCRWFDKNGILRCSTFNILEINIVKKTKEKQQEIHSTPEQSLPSIDDYDEDTLPF